MSLNTRSMRAASPDWALRSTSSYSAAAWAALLRWKYCQPFQATKAPATSSTTQVIRVP
jgi:hypothetical protein